jgi:nucleotide-binding universal stress UspA family protein
MNADTKKNSVIVVGVDGSESSLEGLRWAATQAKVTGATLEAVMAWEWPTFWGRTPTWPPGFDPEDETPKVLAEAVEGVLGSESTLDVREVVVEGHPARVLIAASEHADLLVVGSGGQGGFAGIFLGSVSQHCAASAACPVVVVRHGSPEA